MYRTIVVGMDQGERAWDALAFGRLIAEATGASLIAARIMLFDPRWGGIDAHIRDSDAEQLRSLHEAADSVGGRTATLPSSSPARGLHELAERVDADLVVVGSSPRGRIGRILAGSVALATLHGAPCSVGIAPVGFAAAAPASLTKVTVGYDGSDESQVALAEAIDLARAARAPLRLVTVVEPPPVVYGKGAAATQPPRELRQAIAEVMRGRLEQAVERIPAGVAVEPTLLEGDPAELLAEAAGDPGDVLVLGSRGYGPLRRVLLGSVSTQLVRTAAGPTIVHPRGAGETGGSTLRSSPAPDR